MPTYEYVCEACGHQFEKFQSIKAEPSRLCPKCGKKKLRRLIGAGAGIIFKGSGFYCTDYRSPTYTAAAKSDSAAKTASSVSTTAGAPAASSTPPAAAPAPAKATAKKD
jgi:putative FmdB family regulatory protein